MESAPDVLLRSTTSRRGSARRVILRVTGAICVTNRKITVCYVMINSTPRMGFARVAVRSRRAARHASMPVTVRGVLSSTTYWISSACARNVMRSTLSVRSALNINVLLAYLMPIPNQGNVWPVPLLSWAARSAQGLMDM